MSNGALALAARGTPNLDLSQSVAYLGRLGLAGVVDQIPAQYRPLAQKLSDFNSSGNNGVVSFRLVNVSATSPMGGDYTLNFGAQASVTLDAYDNWPFAGDAIKDRLLSIGASGTLTAGAGLAIPFQFGTVSANANTSAKVDLDYYFDVGNPDQIYALAMAQDLGGLVDPFQFKPLWIALTTGRLRGVVYRFKGTAAFKASVTFAASTTLAELAEAIAIKGDLGAEIDVAATINDDYTLSFVTTSAVPGGERIIVATLGRDPGVEKDLEATLGLTLDLSQLGQYVQSLLKKATDTWQAELNTLKPFLSPGTWIQQQIQNEADKRLESTFTDLVSNQDLRKALVQDAQVMLGVSEEPGEDPLTAWIRTQVTNGLNRVAGVLTTHADQAAAAVVNELGSRFPTLVSDQARDNVTPFLTGKVQALIGLAQSNLEAEVSNLLKAPNQMLGKALSAAGAASASVVSEINAAMAGVRSLFDKYDAVYAKIMAASEQAAKAKLTATVAFAEKSADSVSYRVRGTFTDDGVGAQNVFDSLVRGKLDDVTQLLVQKTKGFDLDPEQSSITRTSTFDQSLGVDIVLLGLEIDAKTLVHAEADVLVDGTGVIRVGAKGTLDQKYNGLNASQDIAFFDVESLVVSGRLSSAPTAVPMQMGFGIATQDKSLTHGLLSGFVKSLVGARLLPADALDRADNILTTWIKAGSDKSLPGEFAVNLTLDEESLRTLLQLGSRPAGVLQPDAVERIIEQTLAAAQEARAIDMGRLAQAVGLIADQYRPALASPTVANAIQYYVNRRVPLPEDERVLGPQTDDDQLIQDFVDEKDRVLNIVKMIQTAGDIYLSTPQNPLMPNGPGWPQARYLKAEKDLASALKPWFKTNAVIVPVLPILSWLLSAAHPRTIALLRAVTNLTGKSGNPPLALTLTYRPPGGQVKSAVIV